MLRSKNPESLWFGTRAVDPDEKTHRVDGVFSSVASRYDIMNDFMSLGVHRLWKNKFVRHVAPRPGYRMLDVAGGTGDIAFRLYDSVKGDADITVLDLNADMLAVGRDRAIDRGILNKMNWIQGNAEKLPFPDQTFDRYTIAFGLRNVTHIDDALAEARRVLRPGGRFFCLEFSQVQDQMLDRVYQMWSTHVIPRMGAMVAGDKDSYDYLVESIRKHPTQAQLARRMKEAGFDRVQVINLTSGIAAIHIGDVL